MLTYVYAVCRRDLRLPPSLEGLTGALRKVCAGDLAAIAGDAPGRQVRPSRRNLVAHGSVLEELQGQGAVLPMRFGQIFPDDDAVRAHLLNARAPSLRALLRRLHNHEEWSVKLQYDEDGLLLRALEGASEASGLGEALGRVRGGGALEERIKLGELCAQAVDRACARDGAHLLEHLRHCAADVAVRSMGGHREPFRASFLVASESKAGFEEALSAAASELPGDATLERSGPLLPYSFVDLEES